MPLPAQHADALRLELDSVEVEHLVPIGTIPGVAVLAAAARNAPGSGTVRSSGDGSLLSWKAPGSSSFGPDVEAAADGDYLLEDGEDPSKWLRVQVWRQYLVPGAAEATVSLRDLYNNAAGHDDVTAAEAQAGDVETYTITMKNEGTLTLSQIKVWLDAATDDLEISENGSSWVNPTSEAAALEFPDLVAGGTDLLHLRRTITGGADPDPNVLNHLHLSFAGL